MNKRKEHIEKEKDNEREREINIHIIVRIVFAMSTTDCTGSTGS